MMSRPALYGCTWSGGVPVQLAPPAYQFVGRSPGSRDRAEWPGRAHAIVTHDRRRTARAQQVWMACGVSALNQVTSASTIESRCSLHVGPPGVDRHREVQPRIVRVVADLEIVPVRRRRVIALEL